MEKRLEMLQLYRRRMWLTRCLSALAGACLWGRSISGQAYSEETIQKKIKAHKPEMRWIENRSIKLGIDLNLGGAITWLSTTQHPENMVNNWDWGRQIQMSFYAGPSKYRVAGKEVASAWADFPWNPVQAGDHFGNASKVIAFEQEQHSLKVTAIPMQWSLNDSPCECEVSSVIRLQDHQVLLQQKLENRRSDTTLYPASDQELPAVYLTGNFNRLICYRGGEPWTNQPWEEVEHHPQPGEFPWLKLFCTEGWAALVDQSGYGCGIWQSNNPTFLGGIADNRTPAQRLKAPQEGVGTTDFPTGYLTSVRPEQLEAGSSYSFETRLVLGSIEEIRSTISKMADHSGLPHWSFNKDRHGWTWQGPLQELQACKASPQTTSVRAGVVTGGAMHLISPPCVWQLARSRRVMAEVHIQTTQPVRLDLYWQHPNDRAFVASQMVSTLFDPASSQNAGENSVSFQQVTWELPLATDKPDQQLVSRIRISFATTDGTSPLPVQFQSIRATKVV